VATDPTLIFDLNGTLTDPRVLGSPWEVPELGLAVLDRTIQSAMAETLFGAYHEFRQHLEGALREEVRRRDLDASRIDEALAEAQRLPPFPEVAAALHRLASAGHRLAVLTNSGAASGRRTLEAAGIDGCFEQILGVDAVRSFKPHPDTYAHALRELGAETPERVMLVAAHAWDVAGAQTAGLLGALVSRGGEVARAVFPEPDLVVADLQELAEQLERQSGGEPERPPVS
jgi:2-haloacid dehalogenase